MEAIYHFKSVSEINESILEAIKLSFMGKSIVITIEEEQDETNYLMSSEENKAMLLKSIEQANNGELIVFKP